MRKYIFLILDLIFTLFTAAYVLNIHRALRRSSQLRDKLLNHYKNVLVLLNHYKNVLVLLNHYKNVLVEVDLKINSTLMSAHNYGLECAFTREQLLLYNSISDLWFTSICELCFR